MSKKVVCEECDWHGMSDELLTAPHPFDLEDVLTFCPHCKQVRCTLLACDEPGCWGEVTCGTPVIHGVSEGYRQTCSKHVPKP